MPPIALPDARTALAIAALVLILFTVRVLKPTHTRKDHPVEEAKEDIVVLVDEEGTEHEFAVVDIVEVDGREYALLASTEPGENDEDENVLVLRFEEDSLVMIEDEAEFQRVVEYLESLVSE